jgi:hypothetical protein
MNETKPNHNPKSWRIRTNAVGYKRRLLRQVAALLNENLPEQMAAVEQTAIEKRPPEETQEAVIRLFKAAEDLQRADPALFLLSVKELERRANVLANEQLGESHPLVATLHRKRHSGSSQRLKQGMEEYRRMVEDAEQDAPWRK